MILYWIGKLPHYLGAIPICTLPKVTPVVNPALTAQLHGFLYNDFL